tara:strand:- start:510 stop:716 length:207 start_codon:yes stop_codon:yes gene_type:complete
MNQEVTLSMEKFNLINEQNQQFLLLELYNNKQSHIYDVNKSASFERAQVTGRIDHIDDLSTPILIQSI